mmetsp:Transcript_42982/g.130846  ORF Transcript_42982/g.130846 Transcript_42982/m.130846 type:complete len:119 (+) Transcript_42982:996-1352(+)
MHCPFETRKFWSRRQGKEIESSVCEPIEVKQQKSPWAGGCLRIFLCCERPSLLLWNFAISGAVTIQHLQAHSKCAVKSGNGQDSARGSMSYVRSKHNCSAQTDKRGRVDYIVMAFSVA